MIEAIYLKVYNYEILLLFHVLDMLEYVCKHVTMALSNFDDASSSITILALHGRYSLLPILLSLSHLPSPSFRITLMFAKYNTTSLPLHKIQLS